jgi:hypothetical protein
MDELKQKHIMLFEVGYYSKFIQSAFQLDNK